jgi:hypothetical protein
MEVPETDDEPATGCDQEAIRHVASATVAVGEGTGPAPSDALDDKPSGPLDDGVEEPLPAPTRSPYAQGL